MDFQISISGFVAIYLFMLAGFAGWVIIGRVPAILHTPLMSGSNFVHGIVVVGGVYALLNAVTLQEQVIGFCAVLFGAGNAAGASGKLCRSRWTATARQGPRRRPALCGQPGLFVTVALWVNVFCFLRVFKCACEFYSMTL